MKKVFLLVTLAAFIVCGCAMNRKIGNLKQNAVSARIDPAENNHVPELGIGVEKRDTLTVKGENGEDVLIMKAVKDENGEMVATDVIDAAMVTARFKNVAERHGKIDICFDITVPHTMQDSRWQLRFYPDMFIGGDSVRLDPVIITGSEYRKTQLRGYQQYERFLAGIITDSLKLINISQLEVFLKRNIPELFRFKSDSSIVSDEQFASVYGVTEKEAVEHYTIRFLINRNDRRMAQRAKMYRRYVKSPIITEGLRLDTVLTNSDNDFIYAYTQTISARPKLRKVEIGLSGEIFEQDRKIYLIPPSDPLTFYVSSLSSFVDNTERYIMQVIERKAEAHTACYIDFEAGKAVIDPEIGANSAEIGRIKENLASLAENKTFDLDSIIVTASCSPEGGFKYNRILSQKRSEEVSSYFRNYLRKYTDSLETDDGIMITMDEDFDFGKKEEIRFISRSNAENWTMLDALVANDESLSESDRRDYSVIRIINDPDMREAALMKSRYYRHLREKLYPRLRTVKFEFHLHRKGMVKDTIHTTVLDTTYMNGVQAIRDRDYKTAVSLLRPYQDFNAAVAYCAMDMNESAMQILQKLERNDRVEYLLAILYSRKGDDRNAVQCYMNACAKNNSYISRGNLDPEISALIKRYGLNKGIYD